MLFKEFRKNTVKLAAERLKISGIENAKQEAGWLFSHVFGEAAETEAIRPKNTKRFNELVIRRANGEPLQYLLGEWEFYGYPVNVGEGVLIPRPETEFLVEAAKQHLSMRKAALIKQGKIKEADSLGTGLILIDLCAGSGCVSVAMCKETGCRSCGIDFSADALRYAVKNIKLNRLENSIKLYKGDIFDPAVVNASPKADFILANPPYLSKKDMRELQREVGYEPKSALYGGEDGLDFYRKIFGLWKPKLKEQGFFAVEVGYGQAEQVKELMAGAGFKPCVMKDYSGIERIVYADNGCNYK